MRGTIEHLPDEQNRIVLGPETDAFGLPALIVDAAFRNGELDQARSVSARYSAHLSDLGLRQENGFEWQVESYGSHHHMGGARMGSDPSTSVVDADLAVHGHPGVFVLSSAVFPSSSYVNPTLTTQALALRLADHLGGACALTHSPWDGCAAARRSATGRSR